MILNPTYATIGSSWVIEAWENGARFSLRPQPSPPDPTDEEFEETEIEKQIFTELINELQLGKNKKRNLILSSGYAELIGRRLPMLLPEEFRVLSRNASDIGFQPDRGHVGGRPSKTAFWTVQLGSTSSSEPSTQGSPRPSTSKEEEAATQQSPVSFLAELFLEGRPSADFFNGASRPFSAPPALAASSTPKKGASPSKQLAHVLFRALLNVDRLYIEAYGTPQVCNLSVFPSLQYLILDRLPVQYLRSLLTLKRQLKELCVKRTCIDCPHRLLDPDDGGQERPLVAKRNSTSLSRSSHGWCSLRVLNLSGCDVTATDSSLSLLFAATHINLSYNRLTALPGATHLQGCAALEELDLSYNELGRRLNPFVNMGNSLGSLKRLDISHNRLKSLEGLQRLFSLEHIDASYNKLGDASALKEIALVPCLSFIALKGNPLTNRPHYRFQVWAVFAEARSQWPGWGQLYPQPFSTGAEERDPSTSEPQVMPSLPQIDSKRPSVCELKKLHQKQEEWSKRREAVSTPFFAPEVQVPRAGASFPLHWDQLFREDTEDFFEDMIIDHSQESDERKLRGMRRRRLRPRPGLVTHEATINDFDGDATSLRRTALERQAAYALAPTLAQQYSFRVDEEQSKLHWSDQLKSRPTSPFPILPHGSLSNLSTPKAKTDAEHSSSSSKEISPSIVNSSLKCGSLLPSKSDRNKKRILDPSLTDSPPNIEDVESRSESSEQVSPLLASLISPAGSVKVSGDFNVSPTRARRHSTTPTGPSIGESDFEEAKNESMALFSNTSFDIPGSSEYIGNKTYAQMNVHDNLELYFQEQVFSPKLPRPYLASSNQDLLWSTTQKVFSVYREPVLPQNERSPGLYTQGPKIGVNGDEIGTIILERSCLLVMTEAFFYLMDEDWKRQAKFVDAPQPRVLRCHPIWSLRAVTIGFAFQKITVEFGDQTPASLEKIPLSGLQVAKYIFLTRDKHRTLHILNNIRTLANDLRNGFSPPFPKVSISNDDEVVLQNVAKLFGNKINFEILVYQMLFQRWKQRPQILIPRTLIVLRSGEVILCDEEHTSFMADSTPQNNIQIVDHSLLRNIECVNLEENPLYLTLVFHSNSFFRRGKKWRLVGRTRAAIQKIASKVHSLQQSYSIRERKFASNFF